MKWEQDLVRDIRTFTSLDDVDIPGSVKRESERPTDQWEEFTVCNKNYLTEYFCKIKHKCTSIIEIGVHRNGDKSSTHCFLNNKLKDTVYIGIDLEDKSFLNDEDKKIYTIKGDSGNFESNIEIIKNLGVEQVDFLFIDGWHSINQILKDWEYTKLLSPHGIVGFHDTSEHPGPYLFIRALNPEIWNIDVNLCPNDWGIGFASKK